MDLDTLIDVASRIYEDAPAGSALEHFAEQVLDYTEGVPDLVDRHAVRDAVRDLLEGDGYRRALGRDRLRDMGCLP